MKKITVLTATRAEYGLLSPIIKKFMKNPELDVRVVATGAHLSPEFGLTVNEIRNDNVIIDKEIEILLSSDTPVGISKSMGLAIISFAEYFNESKPDALMVLGDRYETLAVCIAAMNARIPIIHLYGGEATEGLIDDAVRNSISKLSYLHFTATDTFRNRVIQMGEHPDRVFKVGAMGVENALQINKISLDELERSIDFKLSDSYAVLTFHPVTLENCTAHDQVQELLKALDDYPEINFLCTKANADTNGRIINEYLDAYSKTHKNLILVDSLGVVRYLSAVKNAKFVIGNSSSGLIEVPSFKIPTINIGNRQKGRILADSVICCDPDATSISEAIKTALSSKFLDGLSKMVNPYGEGNTSDKIVSITTDFLLNDKLQVMKSFYDL